MIYNNKFIAVSRRRLVAGLAGGAAGAALLPRLAQAAGSVSAIRVSEHATHTRFVLELSQKIDFSVFRLADPMRIVVDLPEIDWDSSAAPAAAGLVKNVRFGLFQPGNTRIVIDLSDPADVKNAFVLPATGDTPFRLVVDLERTTKAKFMASLGPQYRVGAFGGGPAPGKVAAQPAAPAKPAPGKAKKMVVIDPGHGGVDPGAIGVSGIYEKIITLAAARQLKDRLEDSGRYKVALTRERDLSLGLADRRAVAHEAQADIFISLHADSMSSKTIRGLSVYTLSEKASDAEAAALADQENNADQIIGIDLTRESQEVRHILLDLAQRESMNLATKLATKLIGELKREATLLRNGHRFARFAVLKSPDIPSVLIEMGYLSNNDEETLLKTDGYRNKLMAAVLRGVDDHFGAVQTVRRS